MPWCITWAKFSNPSPSRSPSTDVEIEGQVPSSSLPFMPGMNGVCVFGSQVSVWATPPGSQIMITESALAGSR